MPSRQRADAEHSATILQNAPDRARFRKELITAVPHSRRFDRTGNAWMAAGTVGFIGLGHGDKDMSTLCLPLGQVVGSDIRPKQE